MSRLAPIKRHGVVLFKAVAVTASKVPKHWRYYLLGLFLILVGLTLFMSTGWSNFLLAIFTAGSGLYLCVFSSKLEKSLKANYPSSNSEIDHTEININGGNYNEFINGNYVQGDYINIQGNYININQDLFQFNSQIQEILVHLKGQSPSPEEAENQVIQELNNQASKNFKFRKRLFKWKRSLSISADNTELITERLVRHTIGSPSNTSDDSTFLIESKYQTLHDLLRNGRWREADEETARVIHSLIPDNFFYFTSFEAKEIPPGELKKINKLWIKYSQGRFGFSVQQRIWKKVSSIYIRQEKISSYGTAWKDEDAYLAFIDCVGWSIHNNRLYYDDLQYSLTAPSGHLPARIMFSLSQIYYSEYSNHCDLNQKFFNDLMERQYGDYSFIPLWLKRWFLIT